MKFDVKSEKNVFSKLNSSIQCDSRKVIKALNKIRLSVRIINLNASKAIISNNKRKMIGKPMIRKQAYIKNYNNKCKRS